MADTQNEGVNTRYQGVDSGAKTHGRRAVLTGLLAAPLVGAAAHAQASVDPIYPVWRRWRDLEEEDTRLSQAYKAIWDALPNWVKFPRVLVLVGRDNDGKPTGNLFYATSQKEIRQIMGFDHPPFQDATPAQRAAKESRAAVFDAKLEKAIKAAEAEQERSGLSALDRRLDEIMDEESPLLDRIEQSPSCSPVAIAAKIDAGFAHIRGEDFLSDLPHSLQCSILRSVYHDLPADMQDALAPIAAMEGTVGNLHRVRAQS